MVSPTLPTHPWAGSEDALKQLRARRRRIRNVSGTGVLTLRDAGGESVALEVALVAEGIRRLRLRAWKLGRAVFDLTLNEEGLWVWSAESGDGPAGNAATLTAARLARAWGMLVGQLPESTKIVRHDEEGGRGPGGMFTVRFGVNENGSTMLALIHRPTLTVRRYELSDPGGRVQYALWLSDYRLVVTSRAASVDPPGIPWPMRIEGAARGGAADATGDPMRNTTGRFTLRLDDVSINTDPPATAFDPPDRATRRQRTRPAPR